MWQHADWNLCIFCVGFIAGLHKCLVRHHTHSPQRRGRPPALGRRVRPPASTARGKHRRTHNQSRLHLGQAPHQCHRLLCRYISIWCDFNTTGHVAVMLPNPRHVCSHCVLLASYLLEENQWWGQNLLHLNVASLSISGKGKMNCDPSLTFRKHFWNLNKRRLYQSGIFSW